MRISRLQTLWHSTNLYRKISIVTTLITCCQSHIPTLPGPLALTATNKKDIRKNLSVHFTELSTVFDDDSYTKYVLRLKELSFLENYLNPLSHLQHQVTLCINVHDTNPAAETTLAMFEILGYLQEELVELKKSTAGMFCEMLDSSPKRAEARLKSMMMEVMRLLSQSQEN